LLSFLEFSEPFIPGVSGSSKKAAIFLDENEIPFQDGEKQLSFYDLPEGARRKLRGALLLQAQKTLKNPKAVFGSVYLFPGEPRNSELYDAQEFSTLLNACGRHGKEETGIKACLHDEEAIAIARKTMQLHRAMIRNGLHHFFKHALDFGAFFFFDGRGLVEDTVIGTVAGSSQLAKSEEKPVIAISIDENKQVKVSGRASKALVEKGLNLSALMKKASEGIGFGGGHAMAAGASVKAEALEDFLLSAKREIKAQVKK
jgi:RecJ-like exonuclease